VPRPIVSDVAERVYTALGPLVEGDEGYGWVLLHLCHALTAPIADVEAFSGDTDTRPGWAGMLDPTASPDRALPWLGQLVGVQVPPGTSAATARALIQARGGWGRGTPAAITAAARLTLTGGRHVTLTERDGSAYRIRVATYTAETPDTTALHAAVNAALPAGLVAAFDLLTGWTVAQMETEEAAHTIAYLEAHWATVADFEAQIP
jgi:hypothetical protein